MARILFVGLMLLTLLRGTPVMAQTKAETHEQVVKAGLKALSEKALAQISDDGEIANSANAAILLKETIGDTPGVDLEDDSFHCIIHVAKWNFEREVDGEARYIRQNLKDQHWYVFQGGKGNLLSGEEFSANRRIWGSKRVWLVYVHLNSKLASRYTPAYVVSLTKKNPANLDALTGILGLFGIGAGEFSELQNAASNFWGGEPLEMKGWSASDISVLPAVSVKQLIIGPDGQAFGRVDPAVVTQMKLGEAATFDNEGRHRWDAGIAVPIRRATDLKFDTTTGVATPAKIDKTAALAMLSLFPYPIDLKSNASQAVPHLLFGVDISEKPLDQVFVGAGWGPVFANFYAGGSYVKLTAPNAEGKEREWQLTFGVLMKVRGIIDKLK